MTDHLRRDLAPIDDGAWGAIDEEAKRTLSHFLSARALVDFVGPVGWGASSVSLGRVDPIDGPGGDTQARLRQVRPLVELRTPFTLSRDELDAVSRGAGDPDLDPLREAARNAALSEDVAVFQGYPSAGIPGIGAASTHSPISISDDYGEYPRSVARAVAVLRGAGVAGPFAIALGPRCYTGVIETTEHGGYPVLEHIRMILGGPILWAPGVDGAIVLSRRGGDFRITVGEDFSIGYSSHDAESVTLYLEESFTFEVLDPTAAIALVYPR